MRLHAPLDRFGDERMTGMAFVYSPYRGVAHISCLLFAVRVFMLAAHR